MTAVEWLDKQITICFENYSGTTLYHRIEDKIEQAREMEKQQIIDAGNSCAIKQHLHNDMIDKMSNSEAMIFTQTDNLTFGEQYYNETFKTK
jgi:hypothetical protein